MHSKYTTARSLVIQLENVYVKNYYILTKLLHDSELSGIFEFMVNDNHLYDSHWRVLKLKWEWGRDKSQERAYARVLRTYDQMNLRYQRNRIYGLLTSYKYFSSRMEFKQFSWISLHFSHFLKIYHGKSRWIKKEYVLRAPSK